MDNATRAQGFRDVADTMRRMIVEYPNGTVNMRAAWVMKKTHPHVMLGTCHCFAGWFGVANQDLYKDHPRSPSRWFFSTAANAMAQHVGFAGKADFEDWAIHNRAPWGNPYGGEIFYSHRAFGVEDAACLTREAIAAHLEGVAQRLQETPC